MATATRVALLLALTACGFPRPADVGGDNTPGDAAGDMSEAPGTTIQVSSAGDDANDGLTKPVKSLRRAIAIAGTNTEIKKIALAAGRYSTASGETYPYVVPTNVVVAGPTVGGAILAGSRNQPGLMIADGTLQDLELEDFTVAVTASGATHLTNVKVRTSMLAVRGETTAQLLVNNLDITGSTDACGSGILLKGSADLMATTLVARALTSALTANEPSTINISSANITGDPRCVGTAIQLASGKTARLSDSTITAYYSGLSVSSASSSTTDFVVMNTTLRDMTHQTLIGGGPRVTFKMMGGAILNNNAGGAAIEVYGGDWSFTNVKLQGSGSSSLYIQGTPTAGLGTLTMRGCMVTGNVGGITLFDMSAGDLGTAASPGNNTFQSSSGVGVVVDGALGPAQVDAVGNTWNPNVQGADDTGRYPNVATISGPVDFSTGNNYQVGPGLSIRR